MKNQIQKQVLGVPTRSGAEKMPKWLLCKSSGHYQSSCSTGSLALRQSKIDKVHKLGGKAENLSDSFPDHVKRKLRLGAKILQAGGMKKIFKHYFSVREGEKLLKASQCYLSTTAGPIAGLLFITTEKVAFCNEKSIKICSQDGNITRIQYKVSIPVEKILQANEGHNMNRQSQKYIQIVTVDNFEFWLMGFISYRKTFMYLQQTIDKYQ